MVQHTNAWDNTGLSVNMCVCAHARIICALQCRNTRWLHGIIWNFIMSFDFWVLFTLRDQNQINLCNLDLGLFRQHPSSRCSHAASMTGKFRPFHLISTQFVPLGSNKHLFALVKGSYCVINLFKQTAKQQHCYDLLNSSSWARNRSAIVLRSLYNLRWCSPGGVIYRPVSSLYLYQRSLFCSSRKSSLDTRYRYWQ